MLEGMYSAAAGMAAQQQRLDALSNDIANVNTTGYKRVRVAFRDLLYTPQGLATTPNAQEGAGSAATVIGRGATQGSMVATEEPLDVAIEGPGFLQARREDGTRVLTRDGHLKLDDRGRLALANGMLLEPAVTLPAGATAKDLDIGTDGRVVVGDREIGRINLFTVQSVDGLQAVGENLYAPTAESGNAVAAGAATSLRQGTLEGSNVDLATTMTEMMEAQRAFELASRAIKTQERIAEIANGVKR